MKIFCGYDGESKRVEKNIFMFFGKRLVLGFKLRISGGLAHKISKASGDIAVSLNSQLIVFRDVLP
jgi:hypothetical protein